MKRVYEPVKLGNLKKERRTSVPQNGTAYGQDADRCLPTIIQAQSRLGAPSCVEIRNTNCNSVAFFPWGCVWPGYKDV